MSVGICGGKYRLWKVDAARPLWKVQFCCWGTTLTRQSSVHAYHRQWCLIIVSCCLKSKLWQVSKLMFRSRYFGVTPLVHGSFGFIMCQEGFCLFHPKDGSLSALSFYTVTTTTTAIFTVVFLVTSVYQSIVFFWHLFKKICIWHF